MPRRPRHFTQRDLAMLRSLALAAFLVAAIWAGLSATAAEPWKPAKGPLMTRWAKDVSPDKVHPEYPRPQMVRKEWQNLNGLWDYAIRPKGRASSRQSCDGKILVPFPIESALSGVMKRVGPDNRLWYRRTFNVAGAEGRQPAAAALRRGRLGVRPSGSTARKSATHTRRLRPVHVRHHRRARRRRSRAGAGRRRSGTRPTPTGSRAASRSASPNGIWYTPTTGIWQTVWLEPVPQTYIESLKIVPDVDAGECRVTVNVPADAIAGRVEVACSTARREVAQRRRQASATADRDQDPERRSSGRPIRRSSTT